jgi:predicted aconitase with swiveling domain
MKWRGRKIYAGVATGEVIASNMGISFFGGVDPESGIVVERDHDLEGQSPGSYCQCGMRDDHRGGLYHC